MKKTFILLMAGLFGLNSCAKKEMRTDVYKTIDGTSVTFKFFGHASLAIEADGKWIYLDPVSKYSDYKKEHKATAIFITHSHFDHLDTTAVNDLTNERTMIFCDQMSSKSLSSKHVSVMKPGKGIMLFGNIKVEAVPAYNITTGHLKFHPREREDCGYIFTIGGSRIYVAGDTENTSELKSQKDIDVVFLPVNQPFTMTVDEAIDGVKALHPKVFYPYHYGEGDQKTDINRLVLETKRLTDVRIRNME
jgi:L-ascorbate metabolism protein UlaG (beta-lactamase superfamily)